MAIPRGGFILIGPPMLGCPARTDLKSQTIHNTNHHRLLPEPDTPTNLHKEEEITIETKFENSFSNMRISSFSLSFIIKN